MSDVKGLNKQRSRELIIFATIVYLSIICLSSTRLIYLLKDTHDAPALLVEMHRSVGMGGVKCARLGRT